MSHNIHWGKVLISQPFNLQLESHPAHHADAVLSK